MLTRNEEHVVIEMITQGETFDKIAAKLDNKHNWTVIQEYCWSTDKMSWQGSKKMISNRTKKLSANASREQLVMLQEIDQRVQYLYNCAKAMKQKLDELGQTP
ncbi:MAG: hypothetical protein H6505_02985 [Calditrichaeota bacterium]|nr:hypothetical protein [Calditrichota bacterium]